MLIPHSKPTFTACDHSGLADVLRSGYVTNGSRARKFGQQMAARLGRRWGIATQSGTDAITAALHVVGIGRGDCVAVPAYMCSAPLDSIAILGATPIPVDIDELTLSIDPARLNDKEAVRAVIVPHLFGIRAAIDRIQHDVIIEDCAQTLDVAESHDGIGSSGLVTTCSFYGTKLLTTGHGGMLLGNLDMHRDSALQLMNHDNQNRWSLHRHFLMSDLNAALGLSQLLQLDGFLQARQQIAIRYAKALTGHSTVPNSLFSRFLVVAEEMDRVVKQLRGSGIEAKRPVFKPICDLLHCDRSEFPVTAWAYRHILSIPIYPEMPEEWIKRIEDSLYDLRGDVTCYGNIDVNHSQPAAHDKGTPK